MTEISLRRGHESTLLRRRRGRPNRAYRAFLFPALAVILILTIVPLAFSIILSMTSLSYTSTRAPRFIWFGNYLDLLSDPRFLDSLWHSAVLILCPVVFQLIFGFLLALVMNERLPGLGWLRVIFIVPMFFPPIVMGLMWKVLFTPQLGGVNYYLGRLGIEGPLWLADPNYALASIVIAAVWGWTPFVAIMFYTAMQTIPRDLYEASRIDGAGWVQQIRFVTIPLLKDTALVVIVFRIMEGLAIFPIIYVMTSGGPAGSTETTNYYAFISGFEFLKIGYASSIILSFLAILLIILGPSVRMLLRNVGAEGDRA
jgi:multiple sugar transport system permease protein